MPAVPRTEKPIFRVNLHPPRSLGRRAACNIVIAMACVTSTIGLIFWLVGAWPVIGFLGVDVILLSLAFYFSFRAARAEERIELRHGNLRVTRISARGTRQELIFNPTGFRWCLNGVMMTNANFICDHMESVSRLRDFWVRKKKPILPGRLIACCVRLDAIPILGPCD